ncbi:hypothetical protein KFE25_003410 [Diacronema lutheri]|uniref:Uncharacterized protein n=1 Tax=Diacronema lutheri TaxID=2081491 RepID=A0A8J6C7B6_DIALT|nr:hypothetical protein KFE25_003410 [Diacronema lutheri]
MARIDDAGGSEEGAVDMDALSKRISRLHGGSIMDQLDFYEQGDRMTLARVYVLIFNAGSSNEGLYSLQLETAERVDVVLAWELEADAKQYGQLLLEQNMPQPVPQGIGLDEISSFCTESGLSLGVVRGGTFVEPPSRTVEKFDWRPGGTSGEPPQREADGSLSEDQLDELRLRLERASRLSQAEPDDCH